MVFGLFLHPVFIFQVVRFNGATVNEICVMAQIGWNVSVACFNFNTH
jgi:hypothetical protein